MRSYIDCAVIGSGVAGMTAAIYLKRSNLEVLVLEKAIPGGQINQTATIENYPGFKNIDGPTLATSIYEQMKKLDINYKYGNVLEIVNKDDYKIVKTDLEEIVCKTVIIATGRVPRKLGLEQEQELIGRGISFCAICDGFFYRNKVVAVIGGGNSALEESLYLSKICKTVILIHRKDKFNGDLYLQEKIKETQNIKIFYNSVVTKLIEENNIFKGLIINNDESIEADGMFIYIGQVPDTSALGNTNIEMSNGYIIVDKDMKTSINGLYACGDVINKSVYQITTAAADGTIAAMSVKKYLQD